MERFFRCGRLALCACLVPALAQATEPLTAVEIAACADATLTDVAHIRNLEFTTTDRSGSSRRSRASLRYEATEEGLARLRIDFTEPPSLRGTSFLLVEREGRSSDMFAYLPALNTVKRIRGEMLGGSMFGADFTWADIQMFQRYGEAADRRRLPDAMVDGRAVYVIEERPVHAESSRYPRVVQYIDQQSCARVRSEIYDREGRLRKVATSKSSAELGSDVTTTLLVDLVEERETLVLIRDLDVEGDIRDRVFSQGDLVARGR